MSHGYHGNQSSDHRNLNGIYTDGFWLRERKKSLGEIFYEMLLTQEIYSSSDFRRNLYGCFLGGACRQEIFGGNLLRNVASQEILWIRSLSPNKIFNKNL